MNSGKKEKFRILLTGSNGLLGQKTVQILQADEDTELHAISGSPSIMESGHGFSFTRTDIRDYKLLKSLFEEFSPHAVIHAAAISQVGDCEDNHDLAKSINLDASLEIARLAKKNASHFVYLSTDFVFDGENGPYVETDRKNPPNYYGWTKSQAEEKILSVSDDFAVVRTILVYGLHAQMSRPNILSWLISSLQSGKAIKVVEDQYRMPTLVDDLAKACIDLALQKKSGIYHISGTDYVSVFEFAKIIAHVFDLDASLISPISSSKLNENGKRPSKTGFILEKAIRELNYKPHSLVEGLEKIRKESGLKYEIIKS